MHRDCQTDTFESRDRSRIGMMYLGALREILVISLASGLVLIALSNAKTVLLWNSPAQDHGALNANAKPVLGLGFDDERNLLSVHSWPGEFEEIHLETGEISTRRSPHGLFSAAVSRRNSTRILLSQWVDDSEVHHELFVLRDSDVVVAEKLDLAAIADSDVRISADGSVAVVVQHEGLVIGWDLSASTPVRWEYHLCCAAPTNSLSSDGRRLLIVNDDGDATICDAQTGVRQIRLAGDLYNIRSAAWSRDGQRVAIGSQSGEVTVFETQTGERVWQIRLDFLFPRCVAFSDDGHLLGVGGFDKQIRVWDLSSPAQEPLVLKGDSSVVHNLVFACSDSRLYSGSNDGTIREWSLTDAKLIRQLR